MFSNSADLAGRILLSVLFLSGGLSKLGAGYDGTAQYMSAMGIAPALLPLVIATEIVGAIAIIVGFKTRIAAFLLAGFSILSAVFFHLDFADQMQSILFMKNIAIAGGFLMLVSHGARRFSFDAALAARI
ncbi:DoxX family protein [Methylophaga pinxianii]|uniref:DoxX family protein n=1 Tax=Methylophaga pinxianii TaxID=2881052 RepID=UPI001CF27D34|nr:DoxX family protein [Methylophaga pinxianii]MCB2426536.1 DoxX family protein [Methylophaga pinxianii]UPH44901.1 DoxX family protein [Methylophaga pinxianii]